MAARSTILSMAMTAEPEQSEDASIIAAAQRGDRSAFGHLYERYARMVHGVLLARVSHADADDLTQEVFIRAMRHLSTLRSNESFGAWLRTIARNLANDHYRHATPEDALSDNTAAAESVIESRSSEDDAQAQAVLSAIRGLPDAYREPLILRLVEGMTGPEIAARTGMTHGSVRVNLHRGMQQLRAILGAPLENQGELK